MCIVPILCFTGVRYWPIVQTSFKVTSLTLRWPCDCPTVRAATLTNTYDMSREFNDNLWCNNKQIKHNETFFIFYEMCYINTVFRKIILVFTSFECRHIFIMLQYSVLSFMCVRPLYATDDVHLCERDIYISIWMEASFDMQPCVLGTMATRPSDTNLKRRRKLGERVTKSGIVFFKLYQRMLYPFYFIQITSQCNW